MFKTREDLESHHSLDSHTSAKIDLPAVSSTGTSSTDNVPDPDPPGEISALEVGVAGTGTRAPTSSMAINFQSTRSLISSGKANRSQDRAGLATDVPETSARAPRKGQRQTKSKASATTQGSAAQESDMAAEDPIHDFLFFEEERMSSTTQVVCEAAGSGGSENRDVQSVGPAAVCEAIKSALDLSVAGTGTGSGSNSTAETADQCPAVAISVPVGSTRVTTGRPSRSGVAKDDMSSGSSSSARRREDRGSFNPIDSRKDGGSIRVNAKSNRRKRSEDDYEDEDGDESQYEDDAEADDSDYSKSDSTETETRKRGALKGYDFHCPVKDCSRSFNKVFYFISFYFILFLALD
jgi:hypothetical protein